MNRAKLWFITFILVSSIGKTVASLQAVKQEYEENAKTTHKDPKAIDTKTRDCQGHSPLMKAAALGDLELADELILAGAEVDQQSFMEQTALYLAARAGHELVVNRLLKALANVHLQDTNGNSALMAAAFKGHSKIVTLLKNAGAMIEDKDHGQRTALTWACMGGSLATVKILLKAGAAVNLAAIREACQLRRLPKSEDNKSLQIIKALGRAKNFDDDIHYLPAIKDASLKGLIDIVERLVDPTYQISCQALNNILNARKTDKTKARAFIETLLREYQILPESLSKRQKR